MMNLKLWKKLMSAMLALVMVLGMLPMVERPAKALEVCEMENAGMSAYDFTVPGSTIHFLDKDGQLLTEERAWTEGENVVTAWHVFMYRTTQDDLKLGYSTEGTLFIPHRTYEGDRADLLYVKYNNMFRVCATKEPEQTFDGRKLLKPVTLIASNGETTLANAPVYAQTPFAFVYMGNTDANGEFAINATLGQFRLWIASNQGYILNKAFAVSDNTEQISFADEITNAVEIDVAGRTEADMNGPGYFVAVGKPNESDATNLLTTSYLSPDQTVWVTPGTYRVACGIFVQDQYFGDGRYSGLWVDLSDSVAIREKIIFDFAVTEFDGKFSINDSVYGVDEILSCRLYAEDENGYVIPGRAESPYYMPNRVTVTVDGTTYPYTFQWESFSMLYDVLVENREGDSVVLTPAANLDTEFDIPYTLFDKVEREYVIKYYSEFDAMSFPDLFPKGQYYSASFKTEALSADTYRRLESATYFSNVYYIDENGAQQSASCYFGPESYYYMLPACVQNSDSVAFVLENWSEGVADYNVVTVTDALFDQPYVFEPHTEFSDVSFTVRKGAEDETYYETSYSASAVVGNEKFCVLGHDSQLKLPYGEYVLNVRAKHEVYDEETWETTGIDLISHESTYQLSEPVYTIDVDYSDYKSFGIDASTFYSEDYWIMDNVMKQFSLHFADGSVRYYDWNPAPLTMYTETLPEYGQGEMYYYHVQEIYPFAPFVVLEKFAIKEGSTCRFDFRPAAVTVTGSGQFTVNDNAVLTYRVTDGFGAGLTDLWNLLNPDITHRPLTSRVYPFCNAQGNPVDHHYVVDVYFRLKGDDQYVKKSVMNFTEADLGVLAAGEYEGYVEIDLDTYSDEYLVEYPMEKTSNPDEWWLEKLGVYDNVDRVLHGVLRDEFTFTVSGEAHQHNWSDWTAQDDSDAHVRQCTVEGCEEKQTENHQWDSGVQIQSPTCTEIGSILYTCAICSTTKTETLKVLGHDWGEWRFDDADLHVRDCKRNCGVTQQSEGHQWGTWVPVDDIHQMICSICNGTQTDRHDWSEGEITRQPTCSEAGVLTFTCLDCGSTRTESIPKTDHQWGEWVLNQSETNDSHIRYCSCNESQTAPHNYGEGIVTKQPTHTEYGIREFVCGDCGYFLEETIDRISGHSFGEWEPLLSVFGKHYRRCQCGESETGDCVWNQGICTVCGGKAPNYVPVPTLTLDYPTLSFEDEILYNVYYTLDNAASIVEMGLLTFATKDANGTMDTALEVIPGYVSSGSTYMVQSKGIPAKNLGDAVYFKVYAKLTDGSYVYSEIAGYHAVAYANSVLSNDGSSAKAKALVVAMLNYGAAAQEYFGYKTESLMNANLTSAQKALVSAYDESMVQAVVQADTTKVGSFVMNGGYSNIFPTVSFEGAFAINYYFTPSKVADSAPVMYFWNSETYASVDVLTPENATGVLTMVNDGDGNWGAAVEGIAAKQIDETIYVAGFYTSGGVAYPTSVISYSLGKYCQTVAAKGEAFGAATAVYGYYAKAYFN